MITKRKEVEALTHLKMDSLYKEINSGEVLKDFIHETINDMADAVTSTMGPYGKTVILTNMFEGPYLTKDGVSVIKAIGFKNPVKNVIAQLLKEVAEKTLKVAGDGTTTAVCLLQALMEEGDLRLAMGESYLKILDELNMLEEIVVNSLEEMSEELNPEDIYEVATISANGDKAMGELIQEAFSYSNNVKVETGIDFFDKVEKVNGMILDTGYLDSALINTPEKGAIIYDKPHIIIIDGKLNDLKLIADTIKKIEGPFIIIADDVSPNIQTIFRENYNRGALILGLMKTPGFGGHRKNLVKDLEFFTGAKAVSFNDKGYVVCGNVDNIVISKDKTIITKKETSESCKKHASDLEELHKLTEDGQLKDLLELRIRNLKGTLSIIKVGGISSLEVKEKFDRYDDAVRAVTCALEEGIVPGGGQALFKIKEYFLEDKNMTSFFKVLEAPMKKIESNSNFRMDIANKNMAEEKIFDPTKVTKTAFINAVSIAKTLLNADNLILDRTLWK